MKTPPRSISGAIGGIFQRSTFLRFCLVGGLSTIVNYSVFFVLFSAVGVNYMASYATGYLSGVLVGFFLNKKKTFRSESKRYKVEMIKYTGVYTASLFMGFALLWLLVGSGSVQIAAGMLSAAGGLGLLAGKLANPLVANVIVIGFTTVTNYLGAKYLVFNASPWSKRIDYLAYRYRYLAAYIAIGIGSLFVEMALLSLLSQAHPAVSLSTGFIAGMLFSYFLNSRLNFKVPARDRTRTFRMFVVISTFAFCLNILFIRAFISQFIMSEYFVSRFVSSAFIFMLSYSLHRRFTFRGVKEIGIAIYLSGEENVEEIKSKVSYYTDWIHLDLVDRTFNPAAKDVDVSKGYEAEKMWPNVKIMTHVMSKKPSLWIEKIAPFSDVIIVHSEIDEPMPEVLKSIRELGRESGISLSLTSRVDGIAEHMGAVDVIQVLGIMKPGESGQYMDLSAVKILDELNDAKKRNGYKFEVCFDGGIKVSNVNKIKARYIVSGSTVLKSKNVARTIYALKTSSRYYYDHSKDLKNYLRKEIMRILDGTDFVRSGTIVGSFSDSDDVDGISDIDIVVVVDRLTKEKFSEIARRFQDLSPIIKTDYDYDTIINTTFGPLKFNAEKTVVFHLMVYDVQSHIDHCRKSPFTCMDWQRSKDYVKAPLSSICEVTALQPGYFFNSRRSISDYLRDLESGTISYREYDFSRGVREVKKAKPMSDRDRAEFSYHIMKFCMGNFLKLYRGENKGYQPAELTSEFFRAFPENAKLHEAYFSRIRKMKKSGEFRWDAQCRESLLSFLSDFERQFRAYFYGDSSSAYFTRHGDTGKGKTFIGQKSDAGITAPPAKVLEYMAASLSGKAVKMTYSSPAGRCLQTVELLRKKMSIERFIVDERLQEIDYGRAEGKSYAYLKKKYPAMVEGWSSGKDPRFPGGENTADVLSRVSSFMLTLKADISGGGPGKAYVVCTHNVFLRCLIGDLLRIPVHKRHLIDIPHLEFMEVLFTKDGRAFPNLGDEQMERLLRNVGPGGA